MRRGPLSVALAVALVAAVTGCGGDEEYAPLRHPFRGATLLVDDDSPAAHWRDDHDARWLDSIADTPQARWLTGPADLTDLRPYLEAARARGALPVLVLYYVPNRDCAGRDGGGAADAEAYARFIGRTVAVLGSSRAAVVLEPDAVAAECFDDARGVLLADATRRLADAGQHVYLDAGHPRWRTPEEMAGRLRRSGVARAEGFAVNVANRQSTADSHRWGLRLSELVGDREMLIDTSRDGLPAPPDDQWCNPPRQALGQPPTTRPGLARVAALLWIKNPGESDGPCGRGEPVAGVFWPAQARTLIANSPWLPPAARRTAAGATVPVS
ncbi:glycoside hydrolase family 6 protein [Micromonospora soli]|uniref:glycoside hydrolase family 6 protein n=1 Tax=Micromonospora sp. NBRC 110009 TaxID=3061627 RepID=UPI002671B0CD|nr:glycoside hydrolase family 6 protein [Micromonospora sp. NBRC 110009]WKT97010.1 glycoside hydrolase family 6 protein [Micromonospora sp. NBRC 110009]